MRFAPFAVASKTVIRLSLHMLYSPFHHSIMKRILSIVLILLPACFSASGQLPLPQVPSSLTDPSMRADYVALHFYDAMDWNSWAEIDEESLLQDWANFLSVLPHCSAEGRQAAVDKLTGSLPADAIETYSNMAEDYLTMPDSELFDEPTFIMILQSLSKAPATSKALASAFKARYEYLERALPGTTAPDISTGTLQGALGIETDEFTELKDLAGTADRIMIIFYDPECEDCHARMEYLLENPETQGQVNNGELYIATVRITDDVEEIYPILSVPSIYMIDGSTLTVLSRE